jgi:hypothetical protein
VGLYNKDAPSNICLFYQFYEEKSFVFWDGCNINKQQKITPGILIS